MKKTEKKLLGYTYIKYFLSYFLISSILILGFFLIVRNQLTERYFDQLCDETQQKIDNFAEQLDEDILYLSQIDSSINENIDIILSRYFTTTWMQHQTHSELQKYASSSKLIHSIVYVSKQSDTLISTKLPINYQDGKFHFMDSSSLEFDPAPYLGSPAGQLIRLSGNTKQHLIYFPSIQRNANYIYFYVLNLTDLQRQLKNISSLEIPEVALVDNNQQIAIDVTTSKLDSFLVEEVLTYGVSELDKSTSLCVSSKINNGYSIVAMISNDFLSSQINTSFGIAYRSIVLLAIVAFFLIFIAMRLTYLPLHELTKKIVSDSNKGTSYLEQLDVAFTEVEAQKHLLENKLDKYRISMKKTLFDSLINTGYDNKNLAISNIDQFFDVELNSKIFIVYVESPAGNLTPLPLHQFFLEMLPGSDSCIILDTSKNHATFLLNYIGTEPNKKEILIELLYNLYEDYGYRSAISNSSSSPMDIPTLYDNVVKASSFLGQHTIVDFNTLALPSESVSYPHEKLSQFASLLSEYNFIEAKQLMKELFQIVDQAICVQENFPDFYIRCVLIDMLSTIIDSINVSGIKFKAYNDLYYETIYLCRSCSYTENAETIHHNTESLIDFYEAEVSEKMISPAQIKQLIEASYCDPDFSIAIIADNFQISVAYMSYLIKKKLDINFSEYLWSLRLEKAKELLLHTDMSIDEISKTVGYLNTSSFRRKFKQETGITPSQFRSQLS